MKMQGGNRPSAGGIYRDQAKASVEGRKPSKQHRGFELIHPAAMSLCSRRSEELTEKQRHCGGEGSAPVCQVDLQPDAFQIRSFQNCLDCFKAIIHKVQACLALIDKWPLGDVAASPTTHLACIRTSCKHQDAVAVGPASGKLASQCEFRSVDALSSPEESLILGGAKVRWQGNWRSP